MKHVIIEPGDRVSMPVTPEYLEGIKKDAKKVRTEVMIYKVGLAVWVVMYVWLFFLDRPVEKFILPAPFVVVTVVSYVTARSRLARWTTLGHKHSIEA